MNLKGQKCLRLKISVGQVAKLNLGGARSFGEDRNVPGSRAKIKILTRGEASAAPGRAPRGGTSQSGCGARHCCYLGKLTG